MFSRSEMKGAGGAFQMANAPGICTAPGVPIPANAARDCTPPGVQYRADTSTIALPGA